MKKLSPIAILDKIILPLVLIFAARYLGVFVANFFLDTAFSFNLGLDSLPFLDFPQTSFELLLNSISWIFAGLVLAGYGGFMLFRSLHLHEDWLHPKQTWFLHDKGIEFLIMKAEAALHQNGALALLLLGLLVIASFEVSSGTLSPFIFGAVFAEILMLLGLIYVFFKKNLALEVEDVEDKDDAGQP